MHDSRCIASLLLASFAAYIIYLKSGTKLSISREPIPVDWLSC